MRDPERIDKVLNTIKKIWKQYPDLRLCQLLFNITNDANALYYVEDDVLEKALKDYYKLKEK